MKYLSDELRKFMRENNMTTTDMADAADVGDMAIRSILMNDTERVSADTIKRVMRVMGVSDDEVTMSKPRQQVYQNYRNTVQSSLKYVLSVHRDGVTKYCCSYAPEITADTIYWSSADDDRMSCPYGFRSHKQAEWAFWTWKERTGQTGWRFEIGEVSQ